VIYTLRFFSLQNAVCFIILTYLVPVLFTFYVQGVLKFKKNSGAKRLTMVFRILKHCFGVKKNRKSIMQRVDETSVAENGATWTVQAFGTINI